VCRGVSYCVYISVSFQCVLTEFFSQFSSQFLVSLFVSFSLSFAVSFSMWVFRGGNCPKNSLVLSVLAQSKPTVLPNSSLSKYCETLAVILLLA